MNNPENNPMKSDPAIAMSELQWSVIDARARARLIAAAWEIERDSRTKYRTRDRAVRADQTQGDISLNPALTPERI